MSAIAEDISLNDVVTRSEAILVGKLQKPNSTVGHQSYLVSAVLFGDSKSLLGKNIVVRGANEDLFKSIGQARSKGLPTPIPILPTYRSSIADLPLKTGQEVLLFVHNIKGLECTYVSEGAYEDAQLRPTVEKLIVKLKSPITD